MSGAMDSTLVETSIDEVADSNKNTTIVRFYSIGPRDCIHNTSFSS